MLLELRLGNLALAEDVVLRPGAGLTVLTGETGAGKSLIAGALGLLIGGKGDRQLIRKGENLAWVEAVCDLGHRPDLIERARELGLPLAADGLLVLRRELKREGRGRVVINGDVSSQAVLERLGGMLFTIQSQNQQRELGTTGFARDLLDAVLELQPLRDEVASSLATHQRAASALQNRRQEMNLADEQQEMWRYQHDELDRAGLHTDEEQELAEAIAVKGHARAIQAAAGEARQHLDGGQAPARESLGAALAALTPHADKSPRLAAALEQLQTAADLAADATSELERFLDAFQVDPRGLDELHERKALYEELRRKYRRDVPGLLALRDQLAEHLVRQDQALDDLEDLQQARDASQAALERACRTLHDARVAGSPRVAAAAETAIRPLALPDLDVVFAVEPRVDQDGSVTLADTCCRVSAHGADTVRLLVRTNPGEDLGEAAAIVSGGETARMHLGLTLLRGSAVEPLFRLFDEVDAGLGMDAATGVALLLRRLAESTQALVITHLPTVSVHGDQHWRVAKLVEDGRTSVSLALLSASERVDEVARQLGGEGWREGDAAAQTAYARELLAAAGRLTRGSSDLARQGLAES